MAKETLEIFNLVADIIIRWYDQTHTTMTITKMPPSRINSEIMGILLVARKQTLGALTTLANNHILPTQALLRMLIETFVVLAWSLKVTAEEEKEKCNQVYQKLRSWDLSRLKKDKALLENLNSTPEIKYAIDKIKNDIKILRNDDIKGIPNFEQLFNDLGDTPEDKRLCKELYTKFYRYYSRVVHLNRNTTQQLAWVKYENNEPTAVLYESDIKYDGEELLNIACISCDINKTIRIFYGWNFEVMQKDYEQIKLELSKK